MSPQSLKNWFSGHLEMNENQWKPWICIFGKNNLTQSIQDLDKTGKNMQITGIHSVVSESGPFAGIWIDSLTVQHTQRQETCKYSQHPTFSTPNNTLVLTGFL